MSNEQPQQIPSPSLPVPKPTTRSLLPYVPRISIIVAGVDLNCRVDWRHIANSGRWFGRQFDNAGPTQGRHGGCFPAATVRMKEPKAIALIFNSGKMQLLGTRCLADTQLARRKFVRRLRKLGYEPKPGEMTVQNMAANCDTKMTIRLEGLRNDHLLFAHYEPEHFPSLSFKVMKPKMTVLVFARG